jgi:uncharacterized protein (TIGR02757 family)
LHLKKAFDSLYQDYHLEYLDMDPLHLVRRYSDPEDREVAGFIAAALAIGRGDLIRKAVEDVLNRMGSSPARFAGQYDPIRRQDTFKGFKYRFYREPDIGLLVFWLKQIIQRTGSLRAFFLNGYDDTDSYIGPSLSRFVRTVLSLESVPFYRNLPSKGTGIRHFLADPPDGSGCKRLNLFLRWMVRRDSLDLGLWPEISPSKLVIPLDTHIVRLGRNLGLTRRSAPGWSMALEITESLKALDPDDPVKYDFALCTVGKLNSCPENPGRRFCRSCPVVRFCRVVE